MSIFKSTIESIPEPPTDLALVQFILDTDHELRQTRAGTPWLIEEETGKTYDLEQVRARTFGLANAISKRWGIGNDDVVCIFSPNHIEYPIAIWASHRLGAAVSGANPGFSASELQYQLEAVKMSLLVVHPASLPVALVAAKAAGIPADRIVLTAGLSSGAAYPTDFSTVDQLVEEGLRIPQPPIFVEPKLAPGENQKKTAFISFSSGTTGKPKAVAIPHYSIIANVIQFASWSHCNDPSLRLDEQLFRPGDVATGCLPFYHAYGLIINLHACLFNGLAIVVYGKFNWTEFLRGIEKYKITHMLYVAQHFQRYEDLGGPVYSIVPPQVVLFAKHHETKKCNLSSLRYCMAGAAPISPELEQQFHKVLPNCWINQAYGMTETATLISAASITQRAGGTIGSAGRLLSATEAKVVKPDGSLAAPGESGEVYIRGPQTLYNRYLNNPQANAETFIDGWVRTGDEVTIDKNGDIFIVDRLKESIKCRGFQVAPAELEGHLLDHPYVSDVCVVGVPDEFSGEVPMAFVVLSEEVAEAVAKDAKAADEVKKMLSKHVSNAKIRYKWLDGGVEFVDSIPKNPSGKLLRRFLRDKAKQLHGSKAEVPKARL